MEQAPLLGSGLSTRGSFTSETRLDHDTRRYGAYVVVLLSSSLAIAAGHCGWNPVLVFVINSFAITLLMAILPFAFDEISGNLSESLGRLLMVTCDNVVDLAVSIIALKNNQLEIVKALIIGSALLRILLVMGMCFFSGGVANMRDSSGNGAEQSFAPGTAQTMTSLLGLSAATMLVTIVNSATDKESGHLTILTVSRGTATILLIVYVIYLTFQLGMHRNHASPELCINPPASQHTEDNIVDHHQEDGNDEEEREEHMGLWWAGVVLVVMITLIFMCAGCLVSSIDPLVDRAHVSSSFVGLILIPIAVNPTRIFRGIVLAVRNETDSAMDLVVSSSIQISLFLTPLLVIIGWGMGRDMDLHFEAFMIVSFSLSVLVVGFVLMDGKSNYLEGAMLIALYVIIALAYYLTSSEDSGRRKLAPS
ncbi:calcium/proton exchanger [Microdochium trichocladiopsis]|uniref:Vacuolar calcium ion transporter n=1 Tax=Microdochium trichocladiopsis TaxID=1682393 RepID=A0A9P8Y0X2_9PEZI|nr:calcium/proton exchanger [Microdochium trichocladiopsis]KAH7025198.1 calcium/proton exchanger [Microdochium trichocladiopsis]